MAPGDLLCRGVRGTPPTVWQDVIDRTEEHV